MFDDAFFTSIALACGPPPPTPAEWGIEESLLFTNMVIEHCKRSRPNSYATLESRWSRNEYIVGIYEEYRAWHRAQSPAS